MKDLEYHIPKFFLVLPGNRESLQVVCGKNVIMKFETILKAEITGLIDGVKESVSKTHIEC